MDLRSRMIFKALMLQYHPNGQKLLQRLPENFRSEVQALEGHYESLSSFVSYAKDLFDSFHYSWLVPSLRALPVYLQPYAIATFTNEQKKGFKEPYPQKISRPIRRMVQEFLFENFSFEKILPIDQIQKTDFLLLVNWKKERLVQLIDFLGLHDLASEMKQLVDPGALKNIYACLNPKQFHFLKLCMHQKEKISSPKLGIDPSKITRKALQLLLHQRGLVRFVKALFGEPYDLIYHIAHHLDIGRGKILLRDYQPEPIPKITLALKQQVIQLMNFLNNE